MEQVLFTLACALFVALLLFLSFDYPRRVRLVPQVIGFPTFALLLIILLRDLRLIRRGPEPSQSSAIDVVGPAGARDLGDALRLAQLAEDEVAASLDAEGRRRRLVFGVWVVLFAVGSAWTSFMWSVPVALWLIIYYGRRKVFFSTVVSGCVSIGLYLLFVSVLGVRV